MGAPSRAARALCGADAKSSADVLIVGGGITGAMIADMLVEAGLDTVIVDRRGPTKGSTIASTALVQYEIDTPLVELTRKIGKDNAVRAWRRSRLAVTSLHAFFRERGIAAQSRDALYLSGNQLGARELAHEAELRQAAGLETAFLTRAALKDRFGIARSAALLGFDNLTINPRAAAAELLCRAAQVRRAALCAGRYRRSWRSASRTSRRSAVTVTASAASGSSSRRATSFPRSCRRKAIASPRPGRSRRGRSAGGCGRRNA